VTYIPERGDFLRLSFDPQIGHEQMGNRPALVVSPIDFNRKIGFAFVCPVSNTQRQNPFYVKIPDGEAEELSRFCSDRDILKSPRRAILIMNPTQIYYRKCSRQSLCRNRRAFFLHQKPSNACRK